MSGAIIGIAKGAVGVVKKVAANKVVRFVGVAAAEGAIVEGVCTLCDKLKANKAEKAKKDKIGYEEMRKIFQERNERLKEEPKEVKKKTLKEVIFG